MCGKQSGPAKSNEADPEQYQRFLEAAREHSCEENVGRLDELVRRVAKQPPGRRMAKERGKA